MPYEDLSDKDREFLKLENRKKIYELVRKNQGKHFRDFERISKISYGTLKYHLNFLVKHNILIEKKDKNNLRYYTKELSQEDSKIMNLLRQESLRKILLFLVINKNCSHKDLVNLTKLSGSTVSWHLNNLIKNGIIEKNKFNIIIKNKEDIIRLLITYKESFLDSLVNKTIEMWDSS